MDFERAVILRSIGEINGKYKVGLNYESIKVFELFCHFMIIVVIREPLQVSEPRMCYKNVNLALI